MRQDFSIGSQYAGFCRYDLPALGHNPCFSANTAGAGCDGSGEIPFRFNGRVADASWQQRIRGAAPGAVDQRQCPTAVHTTHRIGKLPPRLSLEYGKSVANLGDLECHDLTDRWMRQTAVDDGLKDLLSCHAGNVGGRCHAIDVLGHSRVAPFTWRGSDRGARSASYTATSIK